MTPGAGAPAGPGAPAGGEVLAVARQVADAVLYEGYVLYPYRASAQKNRYRWQFGVIVPEAHAAVDESEPSEIRSQCLLHAPAGARVDVATRSLRVRRRQVYDASGAAVDRLDADGELLTSWDEAVEQEVATGTLAVSELLVGEHRVALSVAGTDEAEDVTDGAGRLCGRVVRSALRVDADMRVSAERVDGEVIRLTTVVRNRTDWAQPGAPRDEVVRRSLAGVHLLLVAHQASFASVADPPPWAADHVDSLTNRHTHPVLVGPPGRCDVVLSAPIILPDHPEVAPESSGDAFDATEIDELLTLSVHALTDEERREARATDPRAAEVVDRAAHLPPEVMERLHGAVRQFDPPPAVTAGAGSDAGGVSGGGAGEAGPTDEDGVIGEDGIGQEGTRQEGTGGSDRARLAEDLAEFLGVDEAPLERVSLGGWELAVGDRVRLRPRRRADAQDLFAAGRVATVERIERDLDGVTYVAVTPVDDPAADLNEWARRFLYFHPEEVEPVDTREEAGPGPA